MSRSVAAGISGIIDLQMQCEALADRLAIATILVEQKDAANTLRCEGGLDPDVPFAAQFGSEGEWITFGHGATPVVGRRLDGVPIVDIAALSARDAEFRQWLRKTVSASGARDSAMRQLIYLFRFSPAPTRYEAARLERWRPVLDKPAYKLGATILRALDESRRHLVPGVVSGTVRREELGSYWTAVQAMARLILLTADVEAAPWLAGMASSFEWMRWTPSMPLLRERSCWLGAVAARSAIAFGTAVIPNYLGILAKSRHPMTTFDALFGLTAIGLSSLPERMNVAKEISLLRDSVGANDPMAPQLTDYIFENAIETLRATKSMTMDDTVAIGRLLNWERGSVQGLASKAGMKIDPTESLPSRRIIGFAMLPIVLQTEKEAFYPSRIGVERERGPAAAEIERQFRRAWLDSEDENVTLH